MEYKDVTVADILDAMERNGYKKVKNEFIEYERTYDERNFVKITDKVLGACAIGQAALNLKLDPHTLDMTVARYLDEIGPGARMVWNGIILDNDHSNKQIPAIARIALDCFLPKLTNNNFTEEGIKRLWNENKF